MIVGHQSTRKVEMKGIFRGAHKQCNDLPQRIAIFRDHCRNLRLEHQVTNSQQIKESLSKLKCCANCTHQCTECDDLPKCEHKEQCSRTPCQYCGKLPRNCKKDEVSTAIDVLESIEEDEQMNDDGKSQSSYHNNDKRSQNGAINAPSMTDKTDHRYGKSNTKINNVYKWEKQLEKLSGAFVTFCLFLCENEIISKLDLDDYFMEQRMVFRLPIETLRSIYFTNYPTDVVNDGAVTSGNLMVKPIIPNTTVMEINNGQTVAVVRRGIKIHFLIEFIILL